MPNNPQENADHIDAIDKAWDQAIKDGKVAVDKKFWGLTYADFMAKVKPSRDARATIATLELQMTSAIDAREDADKVSLPVVQEILKAVAGDPDFGDDCDLYEKMGRKRKSEYKTGLTRKKTPPAK